MVVMVGVVFTPIMPGVDGEAKAGAGGGPTTVTVSFNMHGHGTQVEEQTFPKGGKATKPNPDPSADGYTFGGWYKKDTFADNQKYDFEDDSKDKVNSDLILHAKWTVAVSFDLHGHGSDIDPRQVIVGGKVTEPNPKPSAKGYTFGGWYKDDTFDDSKKWNFNSDTVSAATTLHAKWTAKQMDVSLNQNEGEGGKNSVKATYGSDMPELTELPTKEGFIFAGYFGDKTDPSSTKYYDASGKSAHVWDQEKDGPKPNYEIFAHWTTHSHSFDYSVSGDTITATCSASDCGLKDNKVTATLAATDEEYTGEAYTGASIDGDDAWKAADAATLSL